ncbi:hypothetical protein [Escherichia coli]
MAEYQRAGKIRYIGVSKPRHE